MNERIPRFAVRQPVLVNLLALVTLLVGAFIFSDMTRESLPSVQVGMGSISTAYPGASAAEVEELVTAPLEEAVLALDEDIEQIESTSQEGSSRIFITFDADVEDIGRAVMNVSNAVNGVQDLPEQAERPVVQEGKTNFPVIAVAITGDVPDRTLREVARTLAEKLERLPDVASVNRHGLRQPEIEVVVDPARLSAHGIPLASIGQPLRARVANVPAGSMERGRHSQLVRAMAQVEDAQDVRDVVLRPAARGGAVTIDDVAEVRETLSETDGASWLDGKPGIALVVFRGHGADALRLSERVRELLSEEQARLPEGVSVRSFGDTSKEIVRSLGALYNNALLGLALVMLLLWRFVGLRNAAMAALGIPVALAGGVVVMELLDITINSLSLFALILCLGVIVDDAIIIIENIYRHMEEGMPRKQAAIEGAREVFWPVVSSTLTTSAAFLPLLLMTGTIGKFFSIIPKVVIAALCASLIEALMILPSHMAELGAVKRGKRPVQPTQGKAAAATDRFGRVLRWSLGRPKTLITVGYALCTGLLILAFTTKSVVLFADADVEMFDVRVLMPIDTTREETDRVMREISRRLLALPGDDVEAVQAMRGWTRTALWPVQGDHAGMATVFLKPPEERSSPTVGRQLIEQASAALADLVGPSSLEVVEYRPGPPSGAPVGVRLLGQDRDQLAELAEKVAAEVREIPGTRDVATDYSLGKRELRVEVDERRAALYGLTTPAIADFLRGAFGDAPAAKTRVHNEEVAIKVHVAEEVRKDPARLGRLPIIAPSGAEVALEEVAEIEHARGAATLQRFDANRAVMVTAQLDSERTSSQEVNRELLERLGELRTAHPEVNFDFGGEYEETQESVASLFRAFGLAALLIFTVLASQFRSFAQPLVVMAAIPLGLIGVCVGFLVSGASIGLIALIGVVGLTGIVVNDSLVLVDFINARRERGMPLVEAVVDAARTRFRPILLTSITTIAGLMPLAVGLGGRSPLLAPMATAIAWGLTFSTVLILILIPCLYLTTVRLTESIARWTRPLTRALTDPGDAVDGVAGVDGRLADRGDTQ